MRHATYRADGTLSYVDLGPGRRVWGMTILCQNELRRYDGAVLSMTGQQFHDALRSSYTSNVGTTINFTDPLGGSTTAVHFDSYEEKIPDIHSQIIAKAVGGSLATSYEVSIELLEA